MGNPEIIRTKQMKSVNNIEFNSKISNLWSIAEPIRKIRKSFEFSIERSGYFLDISLHEGPHLVISFESGGFEKDGADQRRTWGDSYFRTKGISHIGVKPTWNNWYIHPPMEDIFLELRPFIEAYDQVMTYGSSMGGFAALTYADLVGADKVLAFCPQSSRNLEICPWEWNTAREKSEAVIDHPYIDAVGNYAAAQKVYIITDLHFRRDRLHAERLVGDNVEIVSAPYIGHSVPLFLQPLKILGDIPINVLNDKFSALDFHKSLRKRRSLKRYFNIMEKKTENREKFARIVQAHKAKSILCGPE